MQRDSEMLNGCAAAWCNVATQPKQMNQYTAIKIMKNPDGDAEHIEVFTTAFSGSL